MIKKIIIIIVVLFTVGFGYWTISPFFINKVVQEELPGLSQSSDQAANSTRKIASGSFIGFDKVHNGEGIVTLYEIGGKKLLRFEEGFRVNNGPDLYVGFGSGGSYVKGSEISRLKGNVGSQNYEIPDNVSLDAYDSVYVWCKAFSVPFIKADLTRLDQEN